MFVLTKAANYKGSIANMHCERNAYFSVNIAYANSNTNAMRGNTMGKFKIPETPPTVNKTVRFPSDLVNAVEAAIQGKDCTFSAFVIAAVRAAIDDLNEE